MEAQIGGTFLKVAHDTFLVTRFVAVLADFDVGLTEFEHAEYEPGQFVSARVDGCRRAEPRFDPPDKGPDGRLASHGGLRRHPQDGCRAIGVLSWFAGEDLPAADPVIGTYSQPGAEVLLAGPGAHIQSDLGNNGLNGQQVQSRQLG